MHCCCCDRNLSDFESTRKSKSTGEYLDMCNACYRTVQDSVPAIESTLPDEVDSIADACVNYELIDDDGEWDE